MPLEIRPTAAAQSFDLFDGDEKIGKICCRDEVLGEDGWAVEDEGWYVTIWSLTGSGKEWAETFETEEEAITEAGVYYRELAEERRTVGKSSPWTISTPMGGQP